MALFTVTRQGRKALETDDWLEAEERYHRALHESSPGEWPDSHWRIEGTHPTHEWDTSTPRHCRNCGGWDNGSYGSHAPCGFDFEHLSLHAHIERWKSNRASLVVEPTP